jgi:hypothetical protein
MKKIKAKFSLAFIFPVGQVSYAGTTCEICDDELYFVAGQLEI